MDVVRTQKKVSKNTNARKRETFRVLIEQADASLLRDLNKLMNRIERQLVNSAELVTDPMLDRLAALNRKLQKGLVFSNVGMFDRDIILDAYSKNSELVVRCIDWQVLEQELLGVIGDVELPSWLADEVNEEKAIHEQRLQKASQKEKARQLQLRNDQPVMPGKWRREAFSRRVYEPITSYVVTSSISEEEGKSLLELLNTPLQGYVGQAYNYDDQGLTEEWMTTFRDGSKASQPSEHDVIRTQIVGLMELLVAQVQDRVCNEANVLNKPPLVLNQDIIEVPVWGIDCYTRRMIEIAIQDRSSKASYAPLVVCAFIEKKLLPAINAQPPKIAHDMTHALNHIVKSGSLRDVQFAQYVLDVIAEYGLDNFKIHPKGTGVICNRPEGIGAQVLVTSYLGELYPAYRWCEKLDVVEQAQDRFELKPTLPDFYNILLERPRQDPDGYGLLYVDASQRANVGSSCSHSCDSNCTSAVVARDGKLSIVLTTNRPIAFGEELTMDYYSITTSDVEWRAAICLCGTANCRGSFLHFATQDELQRVLNSNCGPLWRYASLLRSCSSRPLSVSDQSVLSRHGIQRAVLGDKPELWMKKYASDALRFIEYERKALPCALMRNSKQSKSHDSSSTTQDGAKSLSGYDFSTADIDARCVMEQRVQSLVCALSMVSRVLSNQSEENQSVKPLLALTTAEIIDDVYGFVKVIPSLVSRFLLESLRQQFDSKKKRLAVSVEHKAASSANPNTTPPSTPSVKRGKKDVPTQQEVNQLARDVDKVEQALTAISAFISSTIPQGLAKFREICLNIRSELLKIEHLSTDSARLHQLADVLVLWAHTSNFSCPSRLRGVSSNPITVTARELGTCISRNKILRHYEDRKKSPRLRTSRPCTPLDDDALAVAPVDLPSNSADLAPHTDSPLDDSMDLVDPSSEPSSEVMELPNEAAEQSTKVSPESESVSLMTAKRDVFLSPNEAVFTGSKTYHPLFCFWQLIDWFNAGTDQKIVAPDLFGCVELPIPQECFGESENPYGPRQRQQLLEIVNDDKQQALCWPASLRSTFSRSVDVQANSRKMYGSPFLDAALGQVDALYKVRKELEMCVNSSSGKKATSSAKALAAEELASTQIDNMLPPELPTNWVQCDLCKKWRRVPWNVDGESLSDNWTCPQNTWDPETANCEAPEDAYDATVENTLEYSEGSCMVSADDVGQWRDVYCVKNLVYYEAQVKKWKKPTGKKANDKVKVLFHYKGWSPKFDEWVDFDSDRIKPHNFFTNPHLKDPRSQEAYQGISPIKATVRSAVGTQNLVLVTQGYGVVDISAPFASATKNKKRKSGEAMS